MNVYCYKCLSCVVEFVSKNLLYCPLCGKALQQRGLAEYTARDYTLTGWNCIAFRSKEAGFVMRDKMKKGESAG